MKNPYTYVLLFAIALMASVFGVQSCSKEAALPPNITVRAYNPDLKARPVHSPHFVTYGFIHNPITGLDSVKVEVIGMAPNTLYDLNIPINFYQGQLYSQSGQGITTDANGNAVKYLYGDMNSIYMRAYTANNWSLPKGTYPIELVTVRTVKIRVLETATITVQ